ncbi:hypothetical protein CPC08DRAFT_708137 [Agrocybe pediades]|nr:hypothetical protein CPC08DRAFT_708137 [Agrocybe pediades]
MEQTLCIKNAPWVSGAPNLAAYGFLYQRSKTTYIHLRNNSHRPQPGMLDSLPNELLLHIFSFLELKPYLISRAVCNKWQRLLPHAEVHPIRGRMLQLFHHMLQAPDFLETRPWVLENLQSFDRQAYIDELLMQYPAIPEEFRLWILEWPAKMAPSGEWPGLPMVKFNGWTYGMCNGVDWLAYTTPLLLALVYNKGSPDIQENLTPALLVWRGFEHSRWLLFDKDEPELFGRVLYIDYPDSPAFYPTKKDHLNYEVDPFEIETAPDWIAYVKDCWDIGVLNRPDRIMGPVEERRISRPVGYKFSALYSDKFPSAPWVQRHDPKFHSDIAGFREYV